MDTNGNKDIAHVLDIKEKCLSIVPSHQRIGQYYIIKEAMLTSHKRKTDDNNNGFRKYDKKQLHNKSYEILKKDYPRLYNLIPYDKQITRKKENFQDDLTENEDYENSDESDSNELTINEIENENENEELSCCESEEIEDEIMNSSESSIEDNDDTESEFSM